jgi:PH (Pleckstrin Homology) domain-containing protein
MRLVAGPDGLRVQGVFGSRLLPWSTIREITVGDTESDLGLPVRAPVIKLTDGQQVKAKAASSYAFGHRPTTADVIATDLERVRAAATGAA